MTRPALAVGAALAFLAPVAAAAQTESRFSTDASVTAGYANNPFTTYNGDNGSALVTLDIAPRYQLLTPRSTITLSGDANFQQYLRRYGHNDSYLASLDYLGRLNTHTTAHARLDLSSAVLGAFNGALPLGAGASFAPVTFAPVAGTDGTGTGLDAGTTTTTLLPVTVSPVTPYTDVGLFGTRSRRRTARGSGDMSFTVSPRDSVTVAAYGEVTRYANFADGNYEGFGGSVGYQRRLSDKVSAGLTGSASTYNYHGNLPDNRIYSVQATASVRLSDRWSTNGALGVSFVNGGYAGSGASTSLSGNLDLCRRGPYSNLCIQAARQVAPTGLAGSQYVTTAGLTWNRRLDEHQSVSLSGSYSKVGSGSTTLVATTSPVTTGYPLRTEYAQATAGYSRQLRQRLRAVASVNYRQLLGGGYAGLRSPADYGGQIGLSYRFGDNR